MKRFALILFVALPVFAGDLDIVTFAKPIARKGRIVAKASNEKVDGMKELRRDVDFGVLMTPLKMPHGFEQTRLGKRRQAILRAAESQGITTETTSMAAQWRADYDAALAKTHRDEGGR